MEHIHRTTCNSMAAMVFHQRNHVLKVQIHIQYSVLESKSWSHVLSFTLLSTKYFGGLPFINQDIIAVVQKFILTGIKILYEFLIQNYLQILGMYCYFPVCCKHTLKGEKLLPREYFSESGPLLTVSFQSYPKNQVLCCPVLKQTLSLHVCTALLTRPF